jgi:hypothetical protein
VIKVTTVEEYVYIISDDTNNIEVCVNGSPTISNLDSGEYYSCNRGNFYGIFTEVFFRHFEVNEESIAIYTMIVVKDGERYRELYPNYINWENR